MSKYCIYVSEITAMNYGYRQFLEWTLIAWNMDPREPKSTNNFNVFKAKIQMLLLMF